MRCLGKTSRVRPFWLLWTSAVAIGLCGGRAFGADDLNPVTFRKAPVHQPVVLVQDGQPKVTIVLTREAPKRSRNLNQAIIWLRQFIARATGAKLPIVQPKADVMPKVAGPAIVIGDCEEAAANGLMGKDMPIEGFSIKTARDRVFIVGNDEVVDPRTRTQSYGTAWGVFEFLERFVDVRWYYPVCKDHNKDNVGLCIPERKSLTVEPVWLEDAPVFRKRNKWIVSMLFNRGGNSWPNVLVVHSPNWSRVKEYTENRPEVFQQRSDGTRDFSMLCYGNPKTIETYLENISLHYDQGKKARLGIRGDAITVSPNDAQIACYCEDCRRLWDKDAGHGGTASRVLAAFVDKLAREVKKRRPDKTVIFLPYLNYAVAPEGFKFPDNVEIQLCGMPGIAQHKEPGIDEREQANIDAWIRISGRKIQNWHYSCWPEDKTRAVYLYPHVIKEHYQKNREKTVGSFINGPHHRHHWPRNHLSLYCWLRILWNPDFDVDTAIKEYCRRMYGPAARTMRKLAQMQMKGWEKSRWPGGRLSPKGIYEYSYPRKSVVRMEELLAKARDKAKDDDLILKRIDYYAIPFPAFFQESKEYAEGTGRTPLIVQKVGENPVLDGKLDDEVWTRAEEVPFIRALDRNRKEPFYPSKLKAVWTFEGLTLGFRLSEPNPELLKRNIKGRDDSLIWWNDNVELLLDVTGKQEGEFYHFIVTPNGTEALYDASSRDAAWDSAGVKARSHVGEGYWSLEVFIPFDTFEDAEKPGSGTATVWYGNFTRHRVCDCTPGKKPVSKGSRREYQRLNTTYLGPSKNLADFGPIKFME